MLKKWIIIPVLSLVASAISLPVYSNEDFHPLLPWTYPGHWQNTLAFQWDVFTEEGLPEQSDSNLSLAYKGDYRQRIGDSRAQLQIQPFLRADQNDSQRTHADLREFSATYLGQGWTLRGGLAQVNWGASTLYSIVDIINQRDLVEGDPTAKLGQPLLEYVQSGGLGTLSLYLLPGFREATFPGESGRPRTPIYIDADSAVIDDSQSAPFDHAIRWQHHVGYLHFGLSYFSGMSRVPRFEFNFDFNRPKIIPVYETMQQSGLELQWLIEDLTFNFEAISRRGEAPNYDQLKVGMEQQWLNLFGSKVDLLTSVDYIKETDNDYSTSFLNNDYIFAAQLRFNEPYSAWLALAWFHDPDTREEAIHGSLGMAIDDRWDIKLQAFIVNEAVPLDQEFLSRQQLDQIVDDVLSGNLSSLQGLQNELLELLSDNPYITADNPYLQRFVGDVLLNNGLANLNINSTLDTLNKLYVMGASEQRLGLLGNDDFVRLELTYRF